MGGRSIQEAVEGLNTWRIYRGTLCAFSGQSSHDHLEMASEQDLQLAHGFWRIDIAGAHAMLVRCKRLIFRVPHHHTDGTLQTK